MEEYINVGKIEKEKLGQYKNIIVTEEVILTLERIEHVKKKHKNQYYEIEPYLGDIITNPDYILKEREHEDTIILLKEVVCNKLKVKMIVRLSTINIEGRKNSIITFWKIRERDYRKTIQNSEIIYKK